MSNQHEKTILLSIYKGVEKHPELAPEVATAERVKYSGTEGWAGAIDPHNSQCYPEPYFTRRWPI